MNKEKCLGYVVSEYHDFDADVPSSKIKAEWEMGLFSYFVEQVLIKEGKCKVYLNPKDFEYIFRPNPDEDLSLFISSPTVFGGEE